MSQVPYTTGYRANGPQLGSLRAWFLLCQERPGQAALESDVGPMGWRPASVVAPLGLEEGDCGPTFLQALDQVPP